jgi:IS5 family transposase
MSDRDTSELCTGNLACKYFIGMDIAKQAPDFTTLCVFRNEVLSKFGTDWVEGVFSELVRECQKRGVVFGSIYALDSTHTLSKVNAQKEKERDQRGLDKQDPDAAWGVKGTEKRLTPDNQEVEVVRYFHGYKSHLIAETLNGLVTNLKVTPGNEADINAGDDLLNREMTKEELERIEIITADKAYGDGAFIRILEKDKKIKTAISLSKTFFKGKHKARWQEYTDDPERATARKQRYVIERTNADLKNNHTLGRCRYLGLTKYHFQSIMSCIAHNLKIMTTAITGARLRPI